MTPPVSALPPLRLAPIYKDKIWGGRTLEKVLGRSLPADLLIGESWEISGYPGDVSVVRGGPLDGVSLHALMQTRGDEILGPGGAGRSFPLLYKFLDASDRLSVQVHPDDETATAHGWGERGKTECWYVVDAKPGARIIVGLARATTREAVAAAVAGNRLEDLLNFIDIAAGDVLFMPAGTVHAIMEGTLIYEVQQSSDTTFRLYDWGRVDPAGKPRQLHVQESLESMDTDCHDRHKIRPVEMPPAGGLSRRMRVACRYFALEELTAARDAQSPLPVAGRLGAMTVLRGVLEVRSPAGSIELHKGDTGLLPASLSAVNLSAAAGTQALFSYIPDLMADVVRPLRAAGTADGRIAQLGGNPRRNHISPLL